MSRFTGFFMPLLKILETICLLLSVKSVYEGEHVSVFYLVSSVLLYPLIKAPERHFVLLYSIVQIIPYLLAYLLFFFNYLSILLTLIKIWVLFRYIRALDLRGPYGCGMTTKNIGDYYDLYYFYPCDKEEYLSKLNSESNPPWSTIPWSNSKGYANYLSVYWIFTIILEILPLDVIEDISPIQTENKLPVVLFSHGLASNVTMYSSILRQLASEGYICVAINHKDGSGNVFTSNTGEICLGDKRNQPGTSFANYLDIKFEKLLFRMSEIDRVMKYLKENSSITANNQKINLNLERLFFVGHSYGALTALFRCDRDDKFKATVALDPWIEPVRKLLKTSTFNIKVPLYVEVTPPFHDFAPFEDYPNRIQAILAQNKTHTTHNVFLKAPNTNHYSHSDLFVFFPFLTKLHKMAYMEDPVEDMHKMIRRIKEFLDKVKA